MAMSVKLVTSHLLVQDSTYINVTVRRHDVKRLIKKYLNTNMSEEVKTTKGWEMATLASN